MPARPAMVPVRRAVAAAIPVLVLVQAVIAGQALYGTWRITVHGALGNVTFLLTLAALVLALVARAPRVETATFAVIALLTTAQVGLGYSGRESLDAAAVHIPLGVLVFGLSLAAALLAGRRAPASPATAAPAEAGPVRRRRHEPAA